jgi:hypothetical protein
MHGAASAVRLPNRIQVARIPNLADVRIAISSRAEGRQAANVCPGRSRASWRLASARRSSYTNANSSSAASASPSRHASSNRVPWLRGASASTAEPQRERSGPNLRHSSPVEVVGSSRGHARASSRSTNDSMSSGRGVPAASVDNIQTPAGRFLGDPDSRATFEVFDPAVRAGGECVDSLDHDAGAVWRRARPADVLRSASSGRVSPVHLNVPVGDAPRRSATIIQGRRCRCASVAVA